MEIGRGSIIVKKKRSTRRVESEGVLNIQPLAIRSLLHSSSFSKCAKRKMYNEKIQFGVKAHYGGGGILGTFMTCM
jgi:hypothetical protein